MLGAGGCGACWRITKRTKWGSIFSARGPHRGPHRGPAPWVARYRDPPWLSPAAPLRLTPWGTMRAPRCAPLCARGRVRGARLQDVAGPRLAAAVSRLLTEQWDSICFPPSAQRPHPPPRSQALPLQTRARSPQTAPPPTSRDGFTVITGSRRLVTGCQAPAAHFFLARGPGYTLERSPLYGRDTAISWQPQSLMGVSCLQPYASDCLSLTLSPPLTYTHTLRLTLTLSGGGNRLWNNTSTPPAGPRISAIFSQFAASVLKVLLEESLPGGAPGGPQPAPLPTPVSPGTDTR